MTRKTAILWALSGFILFLLCAEEVPAQDWFWKNPLPQGNDINGACDAGSGILYAVGDFGAVIKSTNGGLNWFLLETSTNTNFRAVSFPTQDWGMVVGDGGVVMNTTDGGSTWSQQVIGAGINLLGVFFSDAMNGTVIGFPGIVLRTTDGGVSWQQQLAGGGDFLHAVQFPTVTHGTIVGSSGSIFRTSNAGKTWSRQVDSTVKYLYGVSFSDSAHGFAVGEGGTILGTSNGGDTWKHLQSGIAYDLKAVSFADSMNGIVVGESNTILTTTDGGITWIPRTSGVPASLTTVVQTGPTTSVALGLSGLAIRTTDGGATWTRRSVGVTVPLYDVTLSDMVKGISVGSFGTVLTTGNGGNSWVSQTSGVTANLYRIASSDVDTAVAVGEGGVIIRTENGGATWSDLTFPVILGDSYWYSGIAFSPNGSALIVGKLDRNAGQGTELYSPVLRSTDKGKTWTRFLMTYLPTPEASPEYLRVWLRSVAFVDSNTAVAVGEGGTVVRSTDGGISWSIIGSGTTQTLNDVAFSKTRIGVGTAVGGGDGTVLSTANGGLTWRKVQILGSTLTSIEYDDSTFAIAVSDNGRVYFTYNGGLNWTTISLLGTNKVMALRTNKDLFGVSSAGGRKIIVVGDGGIILGNESPDIPVRVRKTEILVPASAQLFPNYPNPFNPETVIRFQVSVTSDVRLSIYDVLGHEVAVLLNERKHAGTYQAVWNASRFPSGAYLCRLSVGGSLLTRKLLLIR